MAETVGDYIDSTLGDLTEAQQQVVTIQRTSGKRLDELLSEISAVGLTNSEEISAMLIERHHLTPENADFMAALATKVDPASVEQDKQALRAAFTYSNVEQDLWQILLDDTERPFFAPIRELELSYYGPASEFLDDRYYERGALAPLVASYSANKYPVGGWLRRLVEALAAAGRPDLMERFWSSVTRRTRAAYFAELRQHNGGPTEWLDKYQEYSLRAYDDAIDWLNRVGRVEAAHKMAEDREMVAAGRLPDDSPNSDRRRMDEPLFWDLLSRTRADAVTPDEQVAMLGEMLQSFGAADIKRFGTIYAKQMKLLYDWNAWALAYAMRGGCSDDAFMEFRTWLIMQGDPALLDIAITDPPAAAKRVPEDPELPDGTLLMMIDQAYALRSDTSLELPTIDLKKPKGKEWSEKHFDSLFPSLVAHYQTVRRA